ncbi:MAG: serine/threonine protein kinase [Planctomycetales bacterium]|nr:serine/threonine protein kinase [Planctomycetales bacterium]
MANLKTRKRFGKYLIEKKLGEGGFAVVYQARDTIEGIRVALKIPYAHLVTDESLELFRHEVRMAAKLDHPNIQPLKYADYVDGHFVIVMALGLGTLEERLTKRVSTDTALSFSSQILSAVAFAHENKIIHCDVKPDNFLLFPNNQLRLTDFGIARVANRTLKGSGAGTVGYVAPEQAMGKPSFRSDVFSIGLVMYRMFAGKLPEWPYTWPYVGVERLKKCLHSDVIAVIKKATEVDTRVRYKDAIQFKAAFDKIRNPRKSNRPTSSATVRTSKSGGWKTVRFREFLRHFGRALEAKHACTKCGGPMAETMMGCPWCGKSCQKHQGESVRFTVCCPRCMRGLKSDWTYCPWCFGPGFEPSSRQELSDHRYQGRCANKNCERKVLMPFMRYCPWCKSRVKRRWKLEGSNDTCCRCGWGVTKEYWSFCPWCTKRL